MCISKRKKWILKKSHREKCFFFCIFLQSIHQVDIKNIVDCWKHRVNSHFVTALLQVHFPTYTQGRENWLQEAALFASLNKISMYHTLGVSK